MHKDRLQFETIDLRLVRPLNLLRHTPPRDPRMVEASRLKFLGQLEEEFPSASEPFSLNSIWENIDLLRIRAITRPVFTTALVFILALVFLFGGASITARASQSALPGDRLYSVKTSLENVRLTLSSSISQQAYLCLNFATTRLNEMDRLIQIGRYQDALALAPEFRTQLGKAFFIAEQLEQLDPAQAARLSSELNTRLTAFSARLDEMTSHLPAGYQAQIRGSLPFPSEATP